MQKKKPKPILSLNEQTLYFFTELLEKGYSIEQALHILGIASHTITCALQAGKDVKDILIEKAPTKLSQHFTFFLGVSSIAGAIQSALHMTAFEKQIKKKLYKRCSYPAFLFVFAFAVLLLFTRYIIPQMLESFAIDNTLQTLLNCIYSLQIITLCFLILLCGSFILYLLCSRKKEMRNQFLYRHHRYLPFLKSYLSYQLAGYLHELEKKGIATKEAFQYLASVKKNSLFYFFVQSCITQLKEGRNLEDIFTNSPFLNEAFQTLFRIGAYNDTLDETLAFFMKQQEFAWEHTIQRIGIGIQCCSYFFIAVMVLVVYQIMLVPLSMLETM